MINLLAQDAENSKDKTTGDKTLDIKIQNMMISIFIILYLLIGSIMDLKYKHISKKYIFVGVIGSVFLFVIFRRQEWISSLFGLIIGISIIVLAHISKGGIGAGDGYVIGIIGVLLGARFVMILFCEAILLAALYSIGKLMRCRMKNISFPFLPFIFLSYIVDVYMMDIL